MKMFWKGGEKKKKNITIRMCGWSEGSKKLFLRRFIGRLVGRPLLGCFAGIILSSFSNGKTHKVIFSFFFGCCRSSLVAVIKSRTSFVMLVAVLCRRVSHAPLPNDIQKYNGFGNTDSEQSETINV